jgi:hypothetical protein
MEDVTFFAVDLKNHGMGELQEAYRVCSVPDLFIIAPGGARSRFAVTSRGDVFSCLFRETGVLIPE